MTAPALVEPQFPPLLRGQAVSGDPLAAACATAAEGIEGGTVYHDIRADRLRAAIVLAPEVPLAEAMTMLPVCAIGFQNAFGALSPPEVALHLDWDGGLRLNGGTCGRLRVAAMPPDPDVVPDWMVIALDLALMPEPGEPGDAPDRTCLYEEGCGEIDPVLLLEAWGRHMLVWLNRWQDDGRRPLHAEWIGLLHGVDETVVLAGQEGTLLGVDDRFGALLRDADGQTRAIPLTALLQET